MLHESEGIENTLNSPTSIWSNIEIISSVGLDKHVVESLFEHVSKVGLDVKFKVGPLNGCLQKMYERLIMSEFSSEKKKFMNLTLKNYLPF